MTSLAARFGRRLGPLVRRSASARAWLLRERRRVLRGLMLLVLSPALLLLVMAALTPLPPELREPAAPSLRVTSRGGRLLREVRADDGARARPLTRGEIPPHVRDAVLAAEDRGFYWHPGVNPLAVARAAASNVWHRRVVSGASTLTMQLARTLRPRKKSLWGKVTEAALAVRIEASLSKDQILVEYMNRIAYGPNLRGYAAASHAYLGKAPDELSIAEAALIAGLPRGPSLYAVSRRPGLAKRRRDRVLTRMAEAGQLSAEARDRAVAEPIVTTLDKPAFGAPHLVRELVARGERGERSLAAEQPGLAEALGDRSHVSELTTTLDPDLQRAAEAAVTTTLAELRDKHVTAAAVVALDNATGDVLAWVGSPDFHDAVALGQNDGVVALRQPGSSLKPFVYGEAMAHLGWTGATLLPDLELHIPLPGGGDYVPHDYDTKQRGPTRLREALGNSLNIPAVYTIHQLGTQRVLDLLRALGFGTLTEEAEHYGPALALGAGEVRLLDLARAYATLARGGLARPTRLVTRVTRGDRAMELAPGPTTRVLDERVAAMLTDILSDKSARMSAFGDQNVLELEFDVAAKTGTSKGYRDNVAVGYTRELTVAAWAGNFDGSPMAGVSGIAGAGPIFRAVMEAGMSLRKAAPTRLSLREDAARLGLERTAVCALSGEIPGPGCTHRVHDWLPQGSAEHGVPCGVHEVVALDVRNGLRAGPACGAGVTEERVFERWAPPYVEWAERNRRPRAPAESSPACPSDGRDEAATAAESEAPVGAPRITYPFNGARFVLDPERPGALQVLEVRVEPDARDVVLRVDGAPIKGRGWPLAAGAHTLTAHRGAVAGPPVHVTVR